MKHIIEFNYQVTRNRGLISSETSQSEFIDKLREEVSEWIDCVENEKGDYDSELADIILVCLNISRHYGIDIESQLIRTISKNIGR